MLGLIKNEMHIAQFDPKKNLIKFVAVSEANYNVFVVILFNIIRNWVSK